MTAIADQLEHARHLADRFHVFPLDHPSHPVCHGIGKECRDRRARDGKCERGKHPTCTWSDYSTVDLIKLGQSNYFGGPARNFGIDCGKSGLLVIDEDAFEELNRLCANLGVEMPRTYTVSTRKGRRHFYFRQPANFGNAEGALRSYKINVRGVGGYVVGPGSLHESGVVYEVIDDSEIAPCPEWLVDALTQKASPAKTNADGSITLDTARTRSEWWRNGEITAGNRHAAFIAAAGWCVAMGMERDEAVPIIRDVFHRCADDGTYTLESALGQLDDAYGRWESGTVLKDRVQRDATGDRQSVTDHEGGDEGDRKPTTWRRVDLTDAVAGKDIPPPVLMARADGMRMLYAGKVHWFQGESESCKSWAAQFAAVEVITSGRDVLYIDFEDDENGVTSRLRALGCAPEAILEHLAYLRPDEPLSDHMGRLTPAMMDLELELDNVEGYPLAIIDGVTESMMIEDLGLLDNADTAKWMRLLPKRIAERGPAVVAIDHVTRSAGDDSAYALGAGHKRAGVTGASYRFNSIRPIARAVDRPVEGSVTIRVAKDRPGYVRGHTKEGQVGTMEMVAELDGTMRIEIVSPGDAGERVDLELVSRIIDYLGTYPGASKNAVEKDVPGKTDAVRRTLRWMASPMQSLVRVEHVGQSHRHYLTDLADEHEALREVGLGDAVEVPR